ncbi:UNVERIFIED_CONTAM: hypothetical protein HDU68_005911 [Siphonaria sp. JEL0065]|nr:hypothetical protein HDU68_005911 [Siphonaria sp. JEL0065]
MSAEQNALQAILQQLQQLTTDNQALRQEGTSDPKSTADLRASDALPPGGSELYIDNWNRAVRHLKAGRSVKDAFSITSEVSEDELREARLSATIAKADWLEPPRPSAANAAAEEGTPPRTASPEVTKMEPSSNDGDKEDL